MVSYEKYALTIQNLRYAHTVNGRKETWTKIAKRVCDNVLSVVRIGKDTKNAVYEIIANRKFIPGGRTLSQAGRDYHQTDSCFLLEADDTREGWAELAEKTSMMFMSGGGVGIDYSNIRPYGVELKRSGGIASGPIPLIEMVNAIGAAARQGGERRGAIYASLAWNHDDIKDFINLKADSDLYLKTSDSEYVPVNKLQHTNISVRFDKEWQDNIRNIQFGVARKVFEQTLRNACKYGDPGFQFDNDNQILRNACTEIISSDDCDSCCIGSINLANIDNIGELEQVTHLAILFLLANTEYTHYPYKKVRLIKEKNRRLGLGMMGIAEWFLKNHLPYGYIPKESDTSIYYSSYNFTHWLQAYKDASDHSATYWSNRLSFKKPIATRAIAPTGTISIVGGMTTSGIEPVFHTAYERCFNTLKERYSDNGFRKEKVIEPVVQKWIEQGYNVRDIDTAYTLSNSLEGIERRIAFQAFVQTYIDNGISSTINLPKYEEGFEEKMSPILKKYLPYLRGITFYPNGRYENQPVVPIDIKDVLDDDDSGSLHYDNCKGGVCSL